VQSQSSLGGQFGPRNHQEGLCGEYLLKTKSGGRGSCRASIGDAAAGGGASGGAIRTGRGRAASASVNTSTVQQNKAKREASNAASQTNIDAWFARLGDFRSSGAGELTDELLARVGGVPLPVAADATEADSTGFMLDRSFARQYAQNIANGYATHAFANQPTTPAVTNEELEIRRELLQLQHFWASVERYCDQLR